ncbi:hypothetical protein BD31_I0965 [Candidatus Nitrosopumilus salaria BD31]|uniref:Uncharacterized protein n=1 Tax=Candidatus Nitrosopumilus salarius BD31 TaxID=859350 RepID=I3D3Z0_9ARCH|nr:hypothetical protein [Candidatus Nitrosopumilus salaria]EIJ66433.1 hypothetical protein BD31_I0965 [Candidatus Nitrosopumilus salaria BD31]
MIINDIQERDSQMCRMREEKEDDPQDIVLCSKCSATETRLEKTMYKE